ncbi:MULTISPECIES: serine hydrolase domain-containing protein [Streptosporangium]|uniref:CubicO group peptidase (Beta-lactamase class C family) n=1 Tax=Streptosporangium brasiliense TaxID=47480 RepID=A0ABT9RI19_9ACTN|nr:serine hydrolase domain-containing protein [Streptosporangium brasiliense]MDP9868875.1 CubicO group peptidase (beta-lactamase class C family) [Streptosporangium brasiliense]
MRERVFPGAVWAIGDATSTLLSGTCGLADPTDPASAMRPDTLFDVASLTKILAVWACIGSLWEAGALPLDDPLATFWPKVAGHPLGQVTARHLLTHTAGMPLRANLKHLYGTDPQAVRDGVLHEELHRPIGEAVDYTDRAALVLGYLAEYLSGRPLDRLARHRIWQPLGMAGTCFGPLACELIGRCAPTELDPDTGVHLKGVVHDFSARLLNGVCGIAGVFSTADDLALFQRHLLAPTPGSDPVGFGAAWVAESLQIHTGDLAPARGLFWYPASGTAPEADIYVHYGFTGTGMWISRKQNRWAVLLTNKLYYSRDRKPLSRIRRAFCALTFD